MYVFCKGSATMLNGLKYIEHNQVWSICAMYIIVYNLFEMMRVKESILGIKIYLQIQFFGNNK